jgi:lysozyme
MFYLSRFWGNPTAHKVSVGIGALGTVTAIALATPVVQKWEGVWLTARVDTIGTGKPVSYCYGQTNERGLVKVGTKFTLNDCTRFLAESLPKYNAEISKCIHVPISDMTRAAYISLSYNIGSAGFCHSSIVTLLNGGKDREACNAMLYWVRAQGRTVQGLVNRRRDEWAMCINGLSQPKVKT